MQRNFDYEYNRSKYSSVPFDSLSELKKRELLCDLKIADFIEKNLGNQRLFFAFNHPCLNLLLQLVERILERIEIKIFPLNNKEKVLLGEPLDKIVVPVNVYAKKTLGMTFEDVDACKGGAWDGGENDTGAPVMQWYASSELVDLFYKIYDENL